MHNLPKQCFWTLGVASAISLTPALGTPLASAEEEILVLEEVIVTATKREQGLQDVAIAVTALSEEMVREAKIHNSEDLTFLVPSLNVQKGSNPRQSSFNIRGIGTQSYSAAVEPSVSTMVDGVVLGRSGQAFMQLMDVARVEVLRGPQGTLFGKNSTGGVIHMITSDPAQEHSGEVMGTAISDDEYRAGFTVSGPLSETFGYRLTAGGSDVAGFTKNYYDGDYLNGSEDWSARIKFRWDPTYSLSLKWTSDYAESECDCTASPLRSLEPFGGNEDYVEGVLERIDPVVPSHENTEVNQNSIPGSEQDQYGHALEINWDIGEYVLTSITAARGSTFLGTGDGDLDGQPIDVLRVFQDTDTEQEQFTQELRLASPAMYGFNYVVGLYYFDQEVDRTFIRELDLVPGVLPPGVSITDFVVDTDNWAAFGEANWDFADDWRLIFGARYTEDELAYTLERRNSGTPIGLPKPVDPAGDSTDEDDLSGKLGLQWDFSDAGMAYLTYATGYKGPAFDATDSSDPGELNRVDPETSASWELGTKTTLWDGRLSLNAALFYTVYDDFQGQAYFDPDGPSNCPPDNLGCNPDDDPGAFIMTNAGEILTQGLEVDFVALLSHNWRLYGGLAIIDATIEDYENGPCSAGQQFRGECDENNVQDLSGGDMPFSPDWKLNVTADYTWNRDQHFDMVFRGSLRAQDEVQFWLHQDENTIQDSYAILDASVQFLSHSDRWETTLFVKNLTDEFYASNIFDINSVFIQNGYFHRYAKVAERTYGLEARFRW